MLDQEFIWLVDRIQARKCEEQAIEVKAAARGARSGFMILFPPSPIRMRAV